MPALTRAALIITLASLLSTTAATHPLDAAQQPLVPSTPSRAISAPLFAELEELARVVDIAYCVGPGGIGIAPPFSCLSRCTEFPQFELVTTWNTGPLLSDSSGYIALDHGRQRLIAAFRGTYSLANTIVDLTTIPQRYEPYPGDGGEGTAAPATPCANCTVHTGEGTTPLATPCANCTVHTGFHSAWRHTRAAILPDLELQRARHADYALHLVGHSLGGAVAALAGLELHARGWMPVVTTFGEPRIGNAALAEYLDRQFGLVAGPSQTEHLDRQPFRRVTHTADPVPLLPPSEWGFAMHAGEIWIAKAALSPDVADLERCEGDNDERCAAGQDATVDGESAPRNLLLSPAVRDEMLEIRTEPWGIPTRYRLWQLLFAHRDYFWRLGLCVPGGDPMG